MTPVRKEQRSTSSNVRRGPTWDNPLHPTWSGWRSLSTLEWPLDFSIEPRVCLSPRTSPQSRRARVGTLSSTACEALENSIAVGRPLRFAAARLPSIIRHTSRHGYLCNVASLRGHPDPTQPFTPSGLGRWVILANVCIRIKRILQ